MAAKCRQSGVALLLVLILVASASVIGFSYVTRSTMKLSSSSNLVQATAARYLAGSGLFHGMYVLRVTPQVMAGSNLSPLGPYTLDNSGGSYTFASTPVAGQNAQYQLDSNGTSAGITQHVSMKVQFDSYYRSLLMSMSPKHYWRLGETGGSAASDSAGSQTGAYHNGVVLGEEGGIIHDADKSALFDGVDSYVDLDGLEIHKDAMSLVAWVYPLSGIHTYARIISKSDGVFQQDAVWELAVCPVGADRRLRFRLNADGETKELQAASGNVPVDQWTFVAATYSKHDRMRLYQDGVEVGNLAQNGKTARGEGVDTWIGGVPAGSTQRPWKGRIDEVAVFHRALSPAEIMTLYNARVPDVRVLSWNN